MTDLSTLSTNTLDAMKARLTNWIVYIAAVDLVIVAVVAWLVATRPPQVIMPLVPVLTLPAIALVPFLRRSAAVRRELARRRAP